MKADPRTGRLRRLGHQTLDGPIEGLEVPVVPLLQFVDAARKLRVLVQERRTRTKARMIATFTFTARGDRSTLESTATPCSVKPYGRLREPPQLEITICDFKFAISRADN